MPKVRACHPPAHKQANTRKVLECGGPPPLSGPRTLNPLQRPPGHAGTDAAALGQRALPGYGRESGMTKPLNPPTLHAPNAPRSTLLLGLGNEILRDDSIGLRLARAARERLADVDSIKVIETAEMGLSLLDFVAGVDQLVVLDAIQTRQAPPGFLHEFDGTQMTGLRGASPHFTGLGEVLALGRTLGLPMPCRVKILAVEVEDPFTVSTDLSPALSAAFPSLLDRVVATARLLVPHQP